MKHVSIVILHILFSYVVTAQKQGSFLDPRDGKNYKTITIGDDTWMAENLNYQTRGSSCYDDKSENCDTYGRIYVWPLVMLGSEKEGVQGVCPDGWHVPTDKEWQKLEIIYKKSKSLIPGEESGFDLLFGGSKFTEGNYGFIGKCATFWTSTVDEGNNKFAWTRYIYEDKLYKAPARYSTNKMYGQSLRCIQDQ